MVENVETKNYDVVVIGSGAGGGTLTYALAKKGMRVLLVERGDFIPQEEDNWKDAGFLGQKYHAPSSEDGDFFVGGSTKLYGAALYRLRERDFEKTEHPQGESPAWPVTYGEMEPYYAEAERIYKVHGSGIGDPTDPPRSSPYPYGPVAHEAHLEQVVGSLRGIGMQVSHIPKAVDLRPSGACSFCVTCDGFPCKVHGKMDSEVACVLPALATGRVDILTNTKCLRLITDKSGRKVIEAEVIRNEKTFRVRGAIFALSAGVMGSPEVLLKSRCRAHPNGLANSSGVIGRFLHGHNAGLIFPINGFSKVPELHAKTFAMNEHYFGTDDFPYPLGVIQSSGQLRIWLELPALVRPIVRAVTQRSLLSFFMTEVLPDAENRVFLNNQGKMETRFVANNMKSFRKMSSIAKNIFKTAGFRFVMAMRNPLPGLPWHPAGTVRFGSDSRTSALDPNCRAHDVDNLYVVDVSFLVSSGSLNTTLTVIAQALKTAEKILG